MSEYSLHRDKAGVPCAIAKDGKNIIHLRFYSPTRENIEGFVKDLNLLTDRTDTLREVLRWMKNLEFEMKRSAGVEYHHLWTNLFDNITEAAGEGSKDRQELENLRNVINRVVAELKESVSSKDKEQVPVTKPLPEVK